MFGLTRRVVGIFHHSNPNKNLIQTTNTSRSLLFQTKLFLNSSNSFTTTTSSTSSNKSSNKINKKTNKPETLSERRKRIAEEQTQLAQEIAKVKEHRKLFAEFLPPDSVYPSVKLDKEVLDLYERPNKPETIVSEEIYNLKKNITDFDPFAEDEGPADTLDLDHIYKEEEEIKSKEKRAQKKVETRASQYDLDISQSHEDLERLPDPAYGGIHLPIPRKSKKTLSGKAVGSGSRKRGFAVAIVRPGTGRVKINNQRLVDYFSFIPNREAVLHPLVVTETLGKMDITCNVQGGGITGQAGAVRMAIANALQAYDPDYRPVLKETGLLSRDTREVERKKPGQKKSRKKFQWTKR